MPLTRHIRPSNNTGSIPLEPGRNSTVHEIILRSICEMRLPDGAIWRKSKRCTRFTLLRHTATREMSWLRPRFAAGTFELPKGICHYVVDQFWTVLRSLDTLRPLLICAPRIRPTGWGFELNAAVVRRTELECLTQRATAGAPEGRTMTCRHPFHVHFQKT